MRNPLNKRLPRELMGEIGKYLVIFLFMTGTIAFVSGFLVADGSMVRSYKDSFDKYNIEDGNFEVNEELGDDIQKDISNNASVYKNYYTEMETAKSKGSSNSTLRIYMDRKEVNKICVMKGSLPTKDNEIAVDRMYADNNKLSVGDKIYVGNKQYRISGLVALSDYSALFSNNSDMMFDAVEFGVAVVTETEFNSFENNNIHYNYSWKYDKEPENESEEKYESERFLKKLNEKVKLVNYTPRYMNQSIKFTGDDMSGDKSIMITLLYILISIMAFIFAVTTNNTIVKEAAVIGTLRASGYSKWEMIIHYISVPAVITVISAITGNILGYTVFKNICANMYYASYSLPTYKTIWNAEAFIFTTVIPCIIMVVINFIIVSNKLKLSPLKFLRKDLSKSKNKKAIKLPHFRFFRRFRIRIIFQNISNYATMFIGIIFANVLLMFGMMVMPLLNHFQDDVLNNKISEYQYIIKEPVEISDKSAEKYCITTVKSVTNKFDSEDITIYGIQNNSMYINTEMPKNGVYVSYGYAEKYGLSIGDNVTVKDSYSQKVYKFKIKGKYEYPVALSIFMSADEFNNTFDNQKDYFNGYFSNKKLIDIDEKNISTVFTEKDLTKLTRQMDVSMGSMFKMVNMFAIILFGLLIYLLTKLIIEKNAASISMIKILGYSNSEISRLYLLSTTIVVISAIVISLPITVKIMQLIYVMMMSKFNGWLTFYIKPVIYPEMFAMGTVIYLLVAVILFRRIKRIPMDESLKNVE